MQSLAFRLPEPTGERHRLRPVFLPFSGCPGRCVYCSQELQTATSPVSLASHLQRMTEELETALQEGHPPFELGFFGGTFTGLPDAWRDSFLRRAAAYREKGLVTRIRCSTRPDRVDAKRLEGMRALGLNMVELGIQSFDEAVLRRSKRGYGAEAARTACRQVLESGLQLGIQLLPGLPGHGHRQWRRDVQIAESFQPAAVRIYPCLVLRGTELDALYRAGSYRPWDLPETIRALAFAVFSFWRGNTPVIRMGLAPEPDMLEQVAAGPWHPALGNLVRSRILIRFLYVHAVLTGPGPKCLFAPQRYSGDIRGYRGANRLFLARIGLDQESITFWDRDYFVLEKRGTAGLPAAFLQV